ncbi:MAG: hypothetical protein M3291_12490, partial [Actinomycetota bacterium]|nr:hypothetical protein [Actinomycetota bacterium]
MSRGRRVVVTLLVITALALPAAASAAPPPPTEPSAPYRVEGADTSGKRTAVARSGVDVLAAGRGTFEVRATGTQAEQLRAAGFELQPLPEVPAPPFAGPDRLPPGFGAYHTSDELGVELAVLAALRPDVVRVSSYGTSFEGRTFPLVKISDAVGTDEAESEVLFSCGQHAREHLTVEMCLHIVTRLAEGHGTDPALTALVDSREVWVMPMTNPDGAEFDIATGAFALWRKNRQPTPGSLAIGTDPNRNWATQWGCCGGSSDSPFADDYRGSAPFSASETAQLRDWVGSRVIGGEQQITAHIDWHAFSEVVLWPYGFTESDSAPGLGTEAAATFRALGRRWRRRTATPHSSPVTSMSPTVLSTTGCGPSTASGPTPSRCTRPARS